jgi:hypothetical protein
MHPELEEDTPVLLDCYSAFESTPSKLFPRLCPLQLLGRTLILPVMHREHEEDTPVTLDYFFDFDALTAYFPNVEPRRFLSRAFPDWETMPVHDIDIKLALPTNMSVTGRPQVSGKQSDGRESGGLC